VCQLNFDTSFNRGRIFCAAIAYSHGRAVEGLATGKHGIAVLAISAFLIAFRSLLATRVGNGVEAEIFRFRPKLHRICQTRREAAWLLNRPLDRHFCKQQISHVVELAPRL
jgi:hypothetical protein